jgi:hypothetical protein
MRCAIRLLLGALLLCCVATAHAQLAANPAELQFPLGVVGITSAPMYVTLSNTGNTTLTVVDLWSPSGAGAWARAGGSCGTVPFTLTAQASCTLGYTFTPFYVGPNTQVLRATPDIGNFVNFTLVGEGEQGGLRAQSLNFDVQATGTTVGPLDVTLRNTSAAALTVISLTPATGVYARVGGSCGTVPFTLASQASCTLGYTFTPNGIGEFRQFLRATPTDGLFVDFTLTGEGDRGHLTIDDRNIRFMPAIAVGEISQAKFFTLTSDGRVSMQVLGIAPYQPPPVVSFVRAGGSCGTPPFTLNPFASCTVGYKFAPIAVGEVQMDVQIAHSLGSPESVTFSGEGLPEAPIFANGFD